MWFKFLTAFEKHCQTTDKVTALNFQKVLRKDWSEQKRDDELRYYYEKIQDPVFLRNINELSLVFCPFFLRPFQKIKFHFYKKMRNFIRKIAS